MLLHCGFGFFGVVVVVLILLSALMMCFALWMEKVFPKEFFFHGYKRNFVRNKKNKSGDPLQIEIAISFV